MFSSDLSVLKQQAVLDIDVEDLQLGDFTYQLYQKLVRLDVRGCVLSLRSISGLSASEWQGITAISQGLELLGIRTVVSGISPALALTLVEFTTKSPPNTYLDEDEAIDALSGEQ